MKTIIALFVTLFVRYRSTEVAVNEEGRVTSARAISGHVLLHQAAVQAAYDAKFPPTLERGKPAKVTGVINYDFALPKNND